jgi:hypothetical protein
MAARAHDDDPRVELTGRVEDRLRDVAEVGLADLAAGADAARPQPGHDHVDGVLGDRAAAIGHHRAQPGDGELADVQDDDPVRVVTGQLAGHRHRAADVPQRVTARDVDRQQDIRSGAHDALRRRGPG